MKFLSLTILFLISTSLFGSVFQVTESHLSFMALVSPGSFTISGKQTDPKALKTEIKIENNQVSGHSSFQLEALSTGIGLRDRHMKEKYLEVPKFAESTFIYKKLVLPQDFKGDKIPFEGVLKLHGIEKPVTGIVKSEKKDSKLILEHQFKIKISDFAITLPKYMSVTMKEEVEILVLIEGILQ